MARCQACHREWPDHFFTCPQDGSRLSGPTEHTLLDLALDRAAAPEPNNELATGTEVGEFIIDRKMAQGGMGEIYLAHHPVIGKKAAIKVMGHRVDATGAAVKRFVLEAQAVNQIRHPNIIDVFSIGKLPDERRYMAMEWLEGESLEARLERGPLPLGEALEIIDQIAAALDATHQRGIVHRDLKPGNVFLERHEQQTFVKLLDFGLAKLSDANHAINLTQSGMVMGTPLYIAPEQASSKPVVPATDIYALGTVIYEMLTGRPPFIADSAVEVMGMHLKDPAPRIRTRLPSVPSQLDNLVDQMLSKQADARPPVSAVRECVAALRKRQRLSDLLGEEPTRAAITVPMGPKTVVDGPKTVLDSPRSPSTVVEPQPRKRRWRLWVGTFALFAAASATAMKLSSSGTSPSPAADLTPPPVATAATRGTLAITLPGQVAAEIRVDGQLLATDVSRARVELEAGKHWLEVRAPGFAPYRRQVQVAPGARAVHAAALEPSVDAGPSEPVDAGNATDAALGASTQTSAQAEVQPSKPRRPRSTPATKQKPPKKPRRPVDEDALLDLPSE